MTTTLSNPLPNLPNAIGGIPPIATLAGMTMVARSVLIAAVLLLGAPALHTAEQRWAPTSISASSAETGNPATHAFDANLSTRWSANGIGQWLQADLGQTRTITAVQIAFFKGNERRTRFNIATSANGSTWTNVWTSNRESSGTSLARQRFAFPTAVSARYVRYIGAGNTAADPNTQPWNSVLELDVMGTATTGGNQAPVVAATITAKTATVGTAFSFTVPATTFTDPNGDALTWSASGLPAGLAFTASTRVISGTPTTAGTSTVTVTVRDPGNLSANTSFTMTVNASGALVRFTPTASSASSAEIGNPAAHAFDANLSTRWSANGIGQWLQADLGQTRAISAVQIAFHKGNERRSRFNIATSANGSTWTNVWTSNRESSGTSLNRQNFAFPAAVSARYVRYIGAGNTAADPNTQTWNSVLELDVMGTGSTPPPVVSAPWTPNGTSTGIPTWNTPQAGVVRIGNTYVFVTMDANWKLLSSTNETLVSTAPFGAPFADNTLPKVPVELDVRPPARVTVTSTDGAPIAGATVSVSGQSAKTDGNGNAVLLIPAGQGASATVTLPAGMTFADGKNTAAIPASADATVRVAVKQAKIAPGLTITDPPPVTPGSPLPPSVGHPLSINNAWWRVHYGTWQRSVYTIFSTFTYGDYIDHISIIGDAELSQLADIVVDNGRIQVRPRRFYKYIKGVKELGTWSGPIDVSYDAYTRLLPYPNGTDSERTHRFVFRREGSTGSVFTVPSFAEIAATPNVAADIATYGRYLTGVSVWLQPRPDAAGSVDARGTVIRFSITPEGYARTAPPATKAPNPLDAANAPVITNRTRFIGVNSAGGRGDGYIEINQGTKAKVALHNPPTLQGNASIDQAISEVQLAWLDDSATAPLNRLVDRNEILPLDDGQTGLITLLTDSILKATQAASFTPGSATFEFRHQGTKLGSWTGSWNDLLNQNGKAIDQRASALLNTDTFNPGYYEIDVVTILGLPASYTHAVPSGWNKVGSTLVGTTRPAMVCRVLMPPGGFTTRLTISGMPGLKFLADFFNEIGKITPVKIAVKDKGYWDLYGKFEPTSDKCNITATVGVNGTLSLEAKVQTWLPHLSVPLPMTGDAGNGVGVMLTLKAEPGLVAEAVKVDFKGTTAELKALQLLGRIAGRFVGTFEVKAGMILKTKNIISAEITGGAAVTTTLTAGLDNTAKGIQGGGGFYKINLGATTMQSEAKVQFNRPGFVGTEWTIWKGGIRVFDGKNWPAEGNGSFNLMGGLKDVVNKRATGGGGTSTSAVPYAGMP